MNIGCSAQFAAAFGLEPQARTRGGPLFSWYADYLEIGQRPVLILANDLSRYCVLLLDVPKDQTRLQTLIPEAIGETLLAEGIKPEVVEYYLGRASRVNFTKVDDLKTVALMEQFAKEARRYRLWDYSQPNQVEFNLLMGNWDLNEIGDRYYCSRDLLFAELRKMMGGTEDYQLISTKAFQFMMRLELEGHRIWRRVIVPAQINFMKFHSVIQSAFGWFDRHFHEFIVFHEDRAQAVIVADEEGLGGKERFGVPVELELRAKLTDYLPDSKVIKYVYDFGEGWEHWIELEAVLEDYDKNYPVCLEAEGNSPPEDVGGVQGYNRFLEVLGNPNNPFHEATFEWGKEQGYKDFNLTITNRSLRYSLYSEIQPRLDWQLLAKFK